MDIDIGLGAAERGETVTALKSVLAETYALYMKTHGYHWNVTGPRFKELHEMFMEHYTELWNALDVLAERIRALGAFAPGSSAEMMLAATIPADTDVPSGEEMIINLVKGHEAIARAAKASVAIAEKAGDVVTADLMTQRTDIAEKTAWMLRSSL